MIGFVARHPGITTLVAGGTALAAANLAAPDNDLVGAVNTVAVGGGLVSLLLGATGAFTHANRVNYAVGLGLMGAGMIGTGIHTNVGDSRF